MDKVLHFTDSNFQEEVLKSDKPVLVDFWANWCGPCHMLAPTIKELANDFDGEIKVGKLDVDENQYTASQFGIMSIPTVILFQGGRALTRLVGVQPKHQIAATITDFLEQKASV